jgi:endonuclease YncB( thermonuclease family)
MGPVRDAESRKKSRNSSDAGGRPALWPAGLIRVVFIAALLACGCASQAAAEPIAPDQIRVIDGDTVRLFNMQPNVRLVGFNAPETRRAKCDYERQLGDQATRRIREIVRSEALDFEYVECSCPPGTEETPSCNYGRSCGTLKAGGKDVGDILIDEGLAVPLKCGATKCPKTPKPWCEAKPPA